MSEEKETVFNNIRSFVQKEVNNVISSHLNNKNYNVNDAQIWTNQICDDVRVLRLRSSRTSQPSTRTSSSSPTALSCKRQIADSISQDPASGTTRSMALWPSNGTPPPSSASSTSSDARSDSWPSFFITYHSYLSISCRQRSLVKRQLASIVISSAMPAITPVRLLLRFLELLRTSSNSKIRCFPKTFTNFLEYFLEYRSTQGFNLCI